MFFFFFFFFVSFCPSLSGRLSSTTKFASRPSPETLFVDVEGQDGIVFVSSRFVNTCASILIESISVSLRLLHCLFGELLFLLGQFLARWSVFATHTDSSLHLDKFHFVLIALTTQMTNRITYKASSKRKIHFQSLPSYILLHGVRYPHNCNKIS